MLEKPEVTDEAIIRGLREGYGLSINKVMFLSLGVDAQAAVYRAVATDGTAYFVKLRRGAFQVAAVEITRLLADAGIAAIIAPLVNLNGTLWATVGAFTAVVYPFVDGQDGYQRELSDGHWVELGRALRCIHGVKLPESLRAQIAVERYDPAWREQTQQFVEGAAAKRWPDAAAGQLAAVLRERRDAILDLVDRAERLAG
jgi:spectinomycin phosphotransferase